MRILQVSTSDGIGGAQMIAQQLFHSYRAAGHESSMAVGFKSGNDPDILEIPTKTWPAFWRNGTHSLIQRRISILPRVTSLLATMADLPNWLDEKMGIEQNDYPGTYRLLKLNSQPPQIVQLHNLHNGYFDLRFLPELSQQVPVMLTLHDAWLLSGHCCHSIGCDRWKAGCGQCPDLTIYPSISRDATAFNWRRKRKIFAKSRLYVSTPSRWLMQKVQQSILARAIIEARVIPNGIDLTKFKPGGQEEARAILGLPPDASIILVTANALRGHFSMDTSLLHTVIQGLSRRPVGKKVMFLAVGEAPRIESVGEIEVRSIPYQNGADNMAMLYRAVDIYLHPAKVDTFPTVVLEAMGCGIPVIATHAGGIPEQVQTGRTGFITPPGDAAAIVTRIEELLQNRDLQKRMGEASVQTASECFGMEAMVKNYLGWFTEIMKAHNHPVIAG